MGTERTRLEEEQKQTRAAEGNSKSDSDHRECNDADQEADGEG